MPLKNQTLDTILKVRMETKLKEKIQEKHKNASAYVRELIENDLTKGTK